MAEEIRSTEEGRTEEGDLNFGEVLSRLMAHPEILEMASRAIGGGENVKTASQKNGEDNTGEESAVGTGGTTVLPASLPIDPKLIGAIPEIMELLSPMLKRRKESSGKIPKKHDKRSDALFPLLLALKPYLSKTRCELIDQMIRMEKIGALLRSLE